MFNFTEIFVYKTVRPKTVAINIRQFAVKWAEQVVKHF